MLCPIKYRVSGKSFTAGCPTRLQNPSDILVSSNNRDCSRQPESAVLGEHRYMTCLSCFRSGNTSSGQTDPFKEFTS